MPDMVSTIGGVPIADRVKPPFDMVLTDEPSAALNDVTSNKRSDGTSTTATDEEEDEEDVGGGCVTEPVPVLEAAPVLEAVHVLEELSGSWITSLLSLLDESKTPTPPNTANTTVTTKTSTPAMK